jgi:hypothetical protein
MEVVSLVTAYKNWTVLYVYSLCWCFLCAGMVRTELGVDIERRGVSPCDVVHLRPRYVRFVVETVTVGHVSY